MTDWNETVWDEPIAPAAPALICICDPELRALEVFDLRCPTHGLAVTLREAIRAQKERDRP